MKRLRSIKHRKRLTKRVLPLLLGWALFAYLAYNLYHAPPLPELSIYDPFEILGLSTSSSEKQIKKHYKKLSLKL